MDAEICFLQMLSACTSFDLMQPRRGARVKASTALSNARGSCDFDVGAPLDS